MLSGCSCTECFPYGLERFGFTAVKMETLVSTCQGPQLVSIHVRNILTAQFYFIKEIPTQSNNLVGFHERIKPIRQASRSSCSTASQPNESVIPSSLFFLPKIHSSQLRKAFSFLIPSCILPPSSNVHTTVSLFMVCLICLTERSDLIRRRWFHRVTRIFHENPLHTLNLKSILRLISEFIIFACQRPLNSRPPRFLVSMLRACRKRHVNQLLTFAEKNY